GAVAGQLIVQLRLREVLVEAREPGGDPLVEPGQAHPVDLDRGAAGGDPGGEVHARDPPAAHRLGDDAAERGALAGPAVAGVGDAVVDDQGGGAPGVPHGGVERGDVHDGDVVAVGERVPPVRDVAARGVVLDVEGGQVAARFAAGPLPDEVELVGALQDDDVDGVPDRRGRQLLRRHLDDVVGPGEGAGPAAAVRAA